MQVRKYRGIARSKVVLFAAFAGTFVAGLFLNAASLQAATETFSTSIPASDGLNAPTTATFLLPQFNPALGTLTSIELDFNLNYQGQVNVLNFSGQAQSFTASSSIPIMMDTPSNPSLQLVLAAYSLSSTAGAGFADYPYPGPGQNGVFTFDPLAPGFPLYEGNGSSDYTLSYGNGTYSGTATPGGSGVFFGGDANSNGSAEVTYTYAPVPEPSTLVLLVLGAIGLAPLARRRMAA